MMRAIPVFSFLLSYKGKVTIPVPGERVILKHFFLPSVATTVILGGHAGVLSATIQWNICISQEVVCEALARIRC